MFLRSSSACEQSILARPQLLPPPIRALTQVWSLYLVSHLLDFSLIFVGPLQSFGSPLLLSIQLVFQLPHLVKRMQNAGQTT